MATQYMIRAEMEYKNASQRTYIDPAQLICWNGCAGRDFLKPRQA